MMTFMAHESQTTEPDRRQAERHAVRLRAEAMRIANTVDAHRHPSLNLAVKDLSETGLAAMADGPLEPGERLALYFPSHLGQHVYDLYGRVVRCEQRGTAYRIALQFDALAA